jgi:ubiquinone/menaquinone biosynthesis C-methylase UbiE
LDIGSSAGGLSVALAQAGLQMEGVEPSKVGVEVSAMRAKRLGVNNAQFHAGVGEQLPFADQSFDLVVSLAVLEHVSDVEKVVAETFRVLRPGGFAYFEVPNNFCPFEGHYKMAWLPMMPKALAKHYVTLRGGCPDFLDSLHYMNRSLVFKSFGSAGFTQLTDCYGNYMLGKACGAPWMTKSPRFPNNKVIGGLVSTVFGTNLCGLLFNRAVMLLCQK